MIFPLFLAAQALSATYCVEPTGAGGCFTTIQDAVNAAGAWDTIEVNPGVYFENVVINGAREGLTITGLLGECTAPPWRWWECRDIDPAGPEDIVIDAFPLGGAGAGPGIWVDGVDFVTIQNLTVRNSYCCGGAGIASNIYSTGDFTTLDNVHLIASIGFGVWIDGAGGTVMNSFMGGNGNLAIFITGDTAMVMDNVIYSNGYGVWIIGHDPLIEGNDISTMWSTMWFVGCVYVEGDNAVVRDNEIRNCDGAGIYVQYGNNAYIATNKIRSTYSEGIYLWEMFNTTVEGNDIAGCDDDGIYSWTSSGTGNNTFSDNTVKNVGGDGLDINDDNPTVTGNNVKHTIDDAGLDIYCPNGCTGGLISGNTARYATNDDDGFDLSVSNLVISDNLSEHNAEEGFDIDGDNNTITGNTARYNGGVGWWPGVWTEGFDIGGIGNTLTGNLAEENGGRGFGIYGSATVQSNISRNNARTGINLDDWGAAGTFTVDSNTVSGNQGEGIANNATASTVDITNNTATGNRVDICNDGVINDFTGNTFDTGGTTTPCDLE